MDGLREWDLVLLAVSTYVALSMLVRLMCRRRDSLVRFLSQQAAEEKRKREEQEQAARQAASRKSASARHAA
jgi:hypothetical protein